jgi:hypothetical protein
MEGYGLKEGGAAKAKLQWCPLREQLATWVKNFSNVTVLFGFT